MEIMLYFLNYISRLYYINNYKSIKYYFFIIIIIIIASRISIYFAENQETGCRQPRLFLEQMIMYEDNIINSPGEHIIRKR